MPFNKIPKKVLHKISKKVADIEMISLDIARICKKLFIRVEQNNLTKEERFTLATFISDCLTTEEFLLRESLWDEIEESAFKRLYNKYGENPQEFVLNAIRWLPAKTITEIVIHYNEHKKNMLLEEVEKCIDENIEEES